MAVPPDHFRHFTLWSKWLFLPSSNASTKYSLRMSNTRRGASDWSWQFHQTGHPNGQQLAGKFGGDPYRTHHLGMEMLHSWLKKCIKRGNCAFKRNTLRLISPGSDTIDFFWQWLYAGPFSWEFSRFAKKNYIPTCAWNKGVPRII